MLKNNFKIFVDASLKKELLEALSVDELNKLYTNTQQSQPTQQQTQNNSAQMGSSATDAELKKDEYSKLHPISTSDGVELKKDSANNIVVGTKKPIRVIFSAIPDNTNQPVETLGESDCEMLDDEVLVPIELSPGHKQEPNALSYDIFEVLPPLNIPKDTHPKEAELPNEPDIPDDVFGFDTTLAVKFLN